MNRTIAVGTIVVVALAMVTSAVALPLLGGGVPGTGADGGETNPSAGPVEDGVAGGVDDPDRIDAAAATNGGGTDADGGDPAPDDGEATLVEMGPTTGVSAADEGAEDLTQETGELDQETEDAVAAGVDEGIELAQSQGVDVAQDQRAAAIEGATDSAVQHQAADVEQVQAAAAGAVHGSLLQAQTVEVEGFQAAVAGSTTGALTQHGTANATQLQSAAWGAAHGGLAQHQVVEAEQVRIAAHGAAAGAASEAGEKGVTKPGTIREAAQGAAYGVLAQYQTITVEQRQRITVEHVQHAAAGASAGALEGSTRVAIEQEQRTTIEQRQEVTVKQVQKAAIGAAKGAIVQRQAATVEQTQFAARGAAKGPLKRVQTVGIEQVQRITITQIQEASFGAAKGSIEQSQEATVEQIQAAADGAAQGVLVQRQEVTIEQVQKAATGAAKGSVASAIQYQVLEVEAIQAASFGAGEGAVLQRQVVGAVQVQKLAEGASGGVLVQHQEVTVEQIQIVARSAGEETARVVQHQKISVTQLQILTQETAADTTARAIEEAIDDEAQLVGIVEVEAAQKAEDVDELEGEATVKVDEQMGDGERVVVDAASLSEGGFVAIYRGVDVEADPDAVIGVSDYLSPGDHETVEIELAESLEESGPLVAAVHHDTNDDEAFEYVETDGEEDEPYVAEGGAPTLDGAFYEIEEDDESEGTLSVSDQAGGGDSLEVAAANASVDYVVRAAYGDEVVESETFAAAESIGNETLELDPPIEENTTAEVSVVVAETADEAGEVLANDTIEYTLETEPPEEPEATLSVTDQEGDGETLLIDEANASVDYVIAAEYGGETVESTAFEAGQAVENETLELEPPIEENATVEVGVVAAETADEAGEVLENETVEYALAVEELEVEFLDCTLAEVSGTFREGDVVYASTGFYDRAVFGNTVIEDGVTFGEDVDAPFTGTVAFEVGDEAEVVEGEEEITVVVEDYGTYGTAITGLTTDPDDYDAAGVTHGNPGNCLDAIRPDQPDLSYEGATSTGDGAIDVTFGYENPNDAALPGGTFDGTTAESPPADLEPGTDTVTVEWTPESDDEQLVWTVDMSAFEYDDVPTAETPPAGEIVSTDDESGAEQPDEPTGEPDSNGPEGDETDGEPDGEGETDGETEDDGTETTGDGAETDELEEGSPEGEESENGATGEADDETPDDGNASEPDGGDSPGVDDGDSPGTDDEESAETDDEESAEADDETSAETDANALSVVDRV